MRSLSEIQKDKKDKRLYKEILNATCRTVARRTGQPHTVVKQDDGRLLILEKKLVKENDQVVYENNRRV